MRNTNIDVIIPKWVKLLDTSKCIPGRVYNVYKCKECVLDHKADKLRKVRKISKMKNNKIIDRYIRCACPKRSKLLIKLKICAWCGELVYGKNLKPGRCMSCYNIRKYDKFTFIDNFPVIKIPELRTFYRMNKAIESEDDLEDSSRWNCKNRSVCLECVFKSNGAKVVLGCKNCNDFNELPF